MKNKKKIVLCSILGVLFCIFSVWIYIKLSSVSSLATFKEWFEPSLKGYLLYFFLVVIQILIVPISTMLLIVPALIMFGPISTFFVTLLALMIGSIITYYVGLISQKFALKFINKNATFQYWYDQLEKNGKIFLPYFSIIPIFPDEVICLLAGITKIRFWYFFVVTLISRATHLIFICFLGAIIPMHGWWLLLWLAILIAISFFCYGLSKNQEKIKKWFSKKLVK